MTYLMKRGHLYGPDRETPLAVIRNCISGRTRQVETPQAVYLADATPEGYRLCAGQSGPVLEGKPGYAQGEDPAQFGWPLCRTPRRDHVQVYTQGREWRLEQLNSQNYRVLDDAGKPVLTVIHRGLTGGWDLEAAHALEPWLLCGLFLFCLYLDRENEFAVV